MKRTIHIGYWIRSGLLLLALIYLLPTKGQSVESVRERYFVLDETTCEFQEFLQYLEDTGNPVLLAYEGAALAASAACEEGPLRKLKQFNLGKHKLEKAVDLMADNIEVRFLRYAVKVKAPNILGYNDLADDEEFVVKVLLENSENIDLFLYHEIIRFLLAHADLSSEERKILTKKSNRDG
ncbi:MAG: hypothetical protein K9G67_05175 [Bacteroidales bacterium]|nr:hypothetical protein [Bacteroidales bacterium]MCF8345054.1 hypothetical protein [Bacteroidales bacterium]MCF8352650.1 hypothetical protein [Bacteroidales bacterium]MCF8375725.1 hypothetical protein [Bacteroidales bacterium]MCF8400325.1 hypothetical protein [Bacteroidales bacterium]